MRTLNNQLYSETLSLKKIIEVNNSRFEIDKVELILLNENLSDEH